MKRSILIALSLFASHNILITNAYALTNQQTEAIKAITTLSLFASAVGYVLYKGATQPYQINRTTIPSTQIAQMAWMSMQPRFQQGAINFQTNSACPFQGAINFR